MTSPGIAGTEGVDPPRRKWRYRFGLRWLLVAVTLASLAVGWIGCEHRRAQRQTALVAELAQVGVVVGLEEPTGVGLVLRKFVPEREAWLRELIGAGWFHRPIEFVSWRLEADQIEFAADRLKRLGTVREVQLRTPQSAAHLDRLRSELPDTLVLDSRQLARRPTTVPVTRFASAGVGLLAALGVALVGMATLLAWPLFVRSR
jgi:hypothetical protein